MSFYKMFGFPTGLGALLVRNDVTTLLDKHYFGGGTVDAIAYDAPWQQFRKAFHERYEDGTVNFMGIVQLEQAMNAYHTLYGNFDNISLHCSQLSRVLCDRLQTLNHWNGQEVCELYTHSQEDFGNPHKQGPILNLNLRRSDGAFVGYGEVDRLAALHGIHMRCGGFCNPGATQTWLGLATEHVQQHAKAGHVCWDDKDLIDGQPTGSIRVSLGATSSLQDIGALVAFVQTYFVEREPQPAPIHVDTPLDVRLVDIILYPIKSCGGFHVPDGVDWPLTPLGLKHDREWLLVHAETGMALSQKRYPRMCLIKPFIEHNTLHITAPDCPPLVIDLDDDQTTLADSRVCGSTYRFIVYHNRG
jgi:molybdenum cofactor sulfurtransferase